MRRDTVTQLASIGVMLAFLAVSAGTAAMVSSSIGRNRLVYADSAEKGEPPEVAMGIAMGAFRGLFVNWLWIRANDLKEQGKYHEAVDLARTITRLQPRFPRVWSFHAWNLAYNISVVTNTKEERWNWVKAGIDLIRRQGIPNNPGSILLYKELAWIHLHKIQGMMDDAHQHYKRQFAHEWTVNMGAPPRFPREMRDPKERARFLVDNWLEPIASAAETLEDLYKTNPGVRALVERLEREAGQKPDRSLLEYVEVIRAINQATRGLDTRLPLPDSPLTAILTDPSTQADGNALVRHLRKHLLKTEYSMDPDRMIRYTLKYGPLDWRNASSHAVYWSAMGSEEALLRATDENKQDLDFVNTDRVTIQALQDLYRTGTVFYDIINPRGFRQIPSADYIESYGNALAELTERSRFDSKARVFSFYSAGYENFLRDAIRFVYRKGDRARAEELYTRLRTFEGMNTHMNEMRRQEFSVPLDEFVKNEIKNEERETSPVVAWSEITGALISAFYDGLLSDNPKVFEDNWEYVKMFHRVYQDRQDFKVFINRETGGRMALPPLEIIAAQLLAELAVEAGIPDGALMFRRAPEELRGRAFVFLEQSALRAGLDANMEDGGPGFEFWFPPPANLDMYRRLVAAQIAPEGVPAGQSEIK
ncbi:MAG: hypothetical protein KF768_04445 [Phycisphaeraceae bacterium]|nr:hypothetical protein [Phycisphaeraceae bacterium]